MMRRPPLPGRCSESGASAATMIRAPLGVSREYSMPPAFASLCTWSSRRTAEATPVSVLDDGTAAGRIRRLSLSAMVAAGQVTLHAVAAGWPVLSEPHNRRPAYTVLRFQSAYEYEHYTVVSLAH